MPEQPDHKNPPIQPQIVVLFGILAVSTASIFIKLAQQEVSSITIAAYRLGLATLVLLPVAVLRYRKELKGLSSKDLRLGLLSGLFLAIHFISWITSLEYISIASSVVLVTTTPLWVALFAPFTIKEPITRPVVVGLLLALTGTLVIGLSDVCAQSGLSLTCPPMREFVRGEAFLGDLLALVGAWAAAGYVLIGRRLRAGLSLVPYIFVVYGMAAVILVALMLTGGGQAAGFSPRTLLWLVLLALVPQLLGHSAFNWALGYLPAAYVAVTLLGEPVGSTILGMIFLKEVPGVYKLFGAILIFGGIVIASMPDKRSQLRSNGRAELEKE